MKMNVGVRRAAFAASTFILTACAYEPQDYQGDGAIPTVYRIFQKDTPLPPPGAAQRLMNSLVRIGYESRFDEKSGNYFFTDRTNVDYALVYGLNLNTETTWIYKINPEGDMRGINSHGEGWTYSRFSDSTKYFGEQTCSGFLGVTCLGADAPAPRPKLENEGLTCVGEGYGRVCF